MNKIKISSEFKKELLSTIPSNVYIAKALGVNYKSVSSIKKNFNVTDKSGKYINSRKNDKKFIPQIEALCLKYNQPVHLPHLNTPEKIARLKDPTSFVAPAKKGGKKVAYSEGQIAELASLIPLSKEERMNGIKRLALAWNKTEHAVIQHYYIVSRLKGPGQPKPQAKKTVTKKEVEKVSTKSETLAPTGGSDGTWANVNGKNVFIPKGAQLKLNNEGQIVMVSEQVL